MWGFLSFSLETRSRNDYVTTAPKREPGRRRLISIAGWIVVVATGVKAVPARMTTDFVLLSCQTNKKEKLLPWFNHHWRRRDTTLHLTWLFKQFTNGHSDIALFLVAEFLCIRVYFVTWNIATEKIFGSYGGNLRTRKDSLVVARRYERK